MRVADVQMAVMDKENFIDHGKYDTEGAVASIRPTTINNVTLTGHKGLIRPRPDYNASEAISAAPSQTAPSVCLEVNAAQAAA